MVASEDWTVRKAKSQEAIREMAMNSNVCCSIHAKMGSG